jgi:hypothetical protein
MLQVLHSGRIVDLIEFLVCRYHVQNGGAKMIIGYARVSKAAGAERVFAENVSGAKTDRRQLAKAIEALEAGDVLLVTRLDRLAKPTRDLLNVLDGRRRA